MIVDFFLLPFLSLALLQSVATLPQASLARSLLEGEA